MNVGRCVKSRIGWPTLIAAAVAACAAGLPVRSTLDLRARVGPGATRLVLSAPGPLDYAVAHPRFDLYVVNLTGAGARAASDARMLTGGVVSSYRLRPLPRKAAGAELDVLLAQPAHLTVRRETANSLLLIFTAAAAKNSAPIPAAPPISSVPLPSPSQQAASAPSPREPIAGTTPEPALQQEFSPEEAALGEETGSQRFHGKPISVDFKDVDLKDFFRLIHEISGLNVVVDPDVRGTLTIVLDRVPWDQALDIVLRDNGLASELQGNVLRIATRTTLREEAEQKRELAKAEEQAAPMVTVTRTLSYAKAVALRPTLKQFLSPRGEILADSRSNTLIIRDIPSVLPTIDRLIAKLDRRSPQVEIEARVVEATRAFAREIGTQFGFATAGGNGKNVIGGNPGVGSSPIVRDILPPPPLVSNGPNALIPGVTGSAIPLNANLGASAPTSGILFAHTEPNLSVDLLISAAETKGIGRLLSQPKLITQNNEKATVQQGTKIPVQTVVNNTISVQFVNAVLQLEVTPQITADGNVFMNVHVENTAIDQGIPRILGIPALDTQSENTSVLVNDGGTVVIGGIIVSSRQTNISQVPLFGSIPVIGHLFKHTAISTQTQELLFFLTPRILPG